jgi:NADH-quinone oxidoreductase subunit H
MPSRSPADMVKMFFKEDWTPPLRRQADFWLAPAIAMSALLICLRGRADHPDWGVADLECRHAVFLGDGRSWVYAVMFAGWSSNSKYSPCSAGVRSTAQTLSYEVFMGLALMGVVVQTGSFNMRDIVDAQKTCGSSFRSSSALSPLHIAGVAVAHRSAVRPARSRVRNWRRLPHRVFGSEMGHVLRRRICRRGGGLRHDGDAIYFGGWHPLPYLEFIPPFFWFASRPLSSSCCSS